MRDAIATAVWTAVALAAIAVTACACEQEQGVAADPCAQCQSSLAGLWHPQLLCALLEPRSVVVVGGTDTRAELEKVKQVAVLLQDRVTVLSYVAWGVAALAAFFGGLTVYFSVGQDERRQDAAPEPTKKQE